MKSKGFSAMTMLAEFSLNAQEQDSLFVCSEKTFLGGKKCKYFTQVSCQSVLCSELQSHSISCELSCSIIAR